MTPEWPRPLSFAQFNWELGRIPAAISQDHASGNPGTDPGVHAAKSGPWDTQVSPRGRHGIAPSGTLRAVPFDNAQWEVRMPVWNGPLAPMRIHGTQIG